MATFRMVHTEFWNDPKIIEEMTPEDKYFFLYLLTNPNTTQIGIYQITKKQMAFDMGYSMETVNALLDRFTMHHQLVEYNPDTREIAIKNWGKFNLRRGGKPMLDCVKSELKNVKDQNFISYVSDQIGNKGIKEIFDSYNVSCNDTYNDTSEEFSEHDPEYRKGIDTNGSYDTSTTRGTYRGQYKEEDKEEEEDKEQQQEIEKESNSENPVVVADQSFGDLIKFYEQNIGMITPMISEELGIMTDELNAELALLALKESVIANARNKIRYAQSILKSWKSQNFKTVNDVENGNKRRSSNKAVGITPVTNHPDGIDW